jgi:outer membrane protein assembly factor BamB
MNFLYPIKRFAMLGFMILGLLACGEMDTVTQSANSTFPNVVWTYDAKNSDLQFSEPVFANGVVYIAGMAKTQGHSGRLVALNEATGAAQWDMKREKLSLATPIVTGNVLLVVERGLDGRTLVAVDAASGQARWSVPRLRGGVHPASVDKRVWLITDDSELVALNLADGTTIFKRKVSKSANASPVVADGVVYVADADGELVAFDAINGKQKWRVETEPRGYYEAPVVAPGLVFLDAPLKAYDAQTGAIKWAYSKLTAGFAPFVFDDTLYAREHPDREVMHALDAQTGAEKWSFKLAGTESRLEIPPLVVNATFFALAENDVYALDNATGKLKWKYNLPRSRGANRINKFLGGLAESNGILFVNSAIENRGSTESTSQIRLDAGTGALVGQTTINYPPEILFGVKTINERVYQNSAGKVYVLRAQ